MFIQICPQQLMENMNEYFGQHNRKQCFLPDRISFIIKLVKTLKHLANTEMLANFNYQHNLHNTQGEEIMKSEHF